MNAVSWPWLSAAEPYPDLAGFRPVLGGQGMVSSPHATASSVGAEILKRGGNAVDAAIATSAALMALLPMQCGPGGDAFWLIHRAGDIQALDASGRSPRAASASALRALGHSAVPERSVYAVTVPGAVSGWIEAHRRHGTMDLGALLAPAIKVARSGFPLSRHGAASFAVAGEQLRAKGAVELWSEDGTLPHRYQPITQPRLAETLTAIADSKGEAFYRGAIAQSIVDAVRNLGGWLSREDMAEHRADWVEPISTRFRDVRVFTTPASTQGFALLAALARVQVTSPTALSSLRADDIHLLVEAVGASLQDRDAFSDDRSRLKIKLASLWSPENAADFARRFDRARRSAYSAKRGTRTTKGDTAHLAVVDRDGMAVSLVQSLFFDFGSAIPVSSAGFTLQNRGASFHLEEDAPGFLAGGIRPVSTLIPSMVMGEETTRLVFGCMGGDGQVQTQLQLLIDIIDGGLDVQQAISKPRWYLDRSAEGECELMFESGFPEDVRRLLSEKGHRIRELGRWEEIMGHAQAIALEDRGVMVGAADPRSDGQVAAI